MTQETQAQEAEGCTTNSCCSRMPADQSASPPLFLSITLNFCVSSGAATESTRPTDFMDSTGPESVRLAFAVFIDLSQLSFQLAERMQPEAVLFLKAPRPPEP